MNLEARIVLLEQQSQDGHRAPFAEIVINLPEYPGQPVELQRREVYTIAPGGGLELAIGDVTMGPDTKMYTGIDFERV